MGDIGCFDIRNGKQIWNLNMIRDLNGENAVFGYSVPVLIDNNRLYCIPGGADINIACLDRSTGKIIWSAKGEGETPGYASMILVHHHGKKILVSFTELSLLGIDAITGDVLWTYSLSIKGDAPCNTPIYDNGYLYLVAGHENGAVKLKITEDGLAVSKAWANPDFSTYFGGVVKAGGYLYGSVDGRLAWRSVNIETGEFADSLMFRTGSVAVSGDKLIIYGNDGKAGIVCFANGKMKLIKSFRITAGSNEHFAHPVIAADRIFFRHGDALLIYKNSEL
jgi:outer membrane protein assembly factor BamB